MAMTILSIIVHHRYRTTVLPPVIPSASTPTPTAGPLIPHHWPAGTGTFTALPPATTASSFPAPVPATMMEGGRRTWHPTKGVTPTPTAAAVLLRRRTVPRILVRGVHVGGRGWATPERVPPAAATAAVGIAWSSMMVVGGRGPSIRASTAAVGAAAAAARRAIRRRKGGLVVCQEQRCVWGGARVRQGCAKEHFSVAKLGFKLAA